jgi:glutamine synthetase
MLRVPDPGRVEDRCIDGSANPYLAMSALISCGLDGIERGIDPGDPCELNLLKIDEADGASLGLRAMPMTLWHALEHLEGDEVLRAGLGKTADGDYVDYFVSTKRDEVRAAHAPVTAWEIERYLEAF